jgi:hypothetical protein
MASRLGKRTCTGIGRASAWKQKPTLLIRQSNPTSTGASLARRAGADPQSGGDDLHPELPALQRAGARPAVAQALTPSALQFLTLRYAGWLAAAFAGGALFGVALVALLR